MIKKIKTNFFFNMKKYKSIVSLFFLNFKVIFLIKKNQKENFFLVKNEKLNQCLKIITVKKVL